MLPRPTSAGAALLFVGISAVLVAACAGSTQNIDDSARAQPMVERTETSAMPTTRGPTSATIGVSVLGPDTAEAPPRVIAVSARNSGEIVARTEPNELSDLVAVFQNPTPIGAPLVFQAVRTDLSAEAEWIEVLLPIRPNGSTGWVSVDEVELRANPYRIEIRPESHELVVFRDNTQILSTSVGIGTGDTPTPRGRFYIIELLETPNPNGPYGPYAFGLSGFSETLGSFAGGDGVIGIHGTNDESSLGTDVSHGCIRVENSVVAELATFLPLGTPVIIESQ